MKKLLKAFVAFILASAIILTAIPTFAVSTDESITVTENNAVSDEVTQTDPYIVCELTEKRDETTKHFMMSDGTIKACIYPENVHYLDNGKYEEIDNTLVEETKENSKYFMNKKIVFLLKYQKR